MILSALGESGNGQNSESAGDPSADDGFQGNPPKSLWEWFKSAINFTPHSEEEIKKHEEDRKMFSKFIWTGIDAGKIGIKYIASVMTIPIGLEGIIAGLETRTGLTQITFKEGSASSFYKILNPSWDGKLVITGENFAATSFKTSEGTTVRLITNSTSTQMATVKIITRVGYQLIFRFPMY